MTRCLVSIKYKKREKIPVKAVVFKEIIKAVTEGLFCCDIKGRCEQIM